MTGGIRLTMTSNKNHPLTRWSGKGKRYKPGSVFNELSSFISTTGHPAAQATYPPTSGEQPSSIGLHGLATRQTYCPEISLFGRWALTPPFHPYRKSGGCFLLCYYPLAKIFHIKKHGALCCPDFPPAQQCAPAMRPSCLKEYAKIAEVIVN